MRCKPGDFCVVVDGRPEYLGMFVTVTQVNEFFTRIYSSGPLWETKGVVRNELGAVVLFLDSTLQPIRPPEQTDQTGTDQDLKIREPA